MTHLAVAETVSASPFFKNYTHSVRPQHSLLIYRSVPASAYGENHPGYGG